MAKEWAHFLQQPTHGFKSNVLEWQKASVASMESQVFSAQLPQHQFLDDSRLNRDDMRSFATLLPSPSAAPNDLHASVSGDRRLNQPTTLVLSSASQHLPQAMEDDHSNMLEIMDDVPLQPQLKSVSPLSMSSSCGPAMAGLGLHGPIASCSETACAGPTTLTTSNQIDCSARLAAAYNDLLPPAGLLSQNHDAMVATDQKQAAARYSDFIAVNSSNSQNHCMTGVDLKLAGRDDILLGSCAGRTCAGAGANGNGYNAKVSMDPDSRLSASSWLSACGARQDLSPEEKEMIYRAAAMQPIDMNTLGSMASTEMAGMEKPKPRRNVRISKDPQSIAARQRRQRISSKMRALQKLVPGGMKMDTASVLEEAAHYLRFLKAEVEKMEAIEQLISVAKEKMERRSTAGQGRAVLQDASHSFRKPRNTMPPLMTQSWPHYVIPPLPSTPIIQIDPH